MSKIIFLKNLQTLLTPLKRLIDRKAENVNWNENDPSASGYIANRPFYKEIKNADLMPSMNVDFSECWNTTKLPVFDLIRGETYTVIFDGVEYQCVAVDDGYGGEALGNFYLIGGGADTGEPFFIYEEEGGEWVGIAISIEEEVTCNIQISGKQATVHKIDSEYLPETIGIQGIGDRAEVFNSGNPEQASGTLSHAEGFLSEAAGLTSHAEGYRTIAGSSCQHAQGQYNIADRVGKYAHIVGNGSESNRSNAHTLDWNGNAWFAGEVYTGGTNQNSGERLAKISEIPDNLVNGTSDGSLRTINSIPENDTYRIGENAFAIGKDTKASGFYSQAQGLNTIALTKSLNVIGENNLIEDNVSSEIIKKQLTGHRRGWDTYYLLHGTPTIDEVSKCFVFESVEATKFYLLQVGDLYTTTNTTTPTVYDEVLLNKTEPQVEATSKWNRYSILSYTEKRGKYAQVVGNGESDSSRSNAHTLDWNGVGWFAGGLKVGGTGQDDENAVEVALKGDIPESIAISPQKSQISIINNVQDSTTYRGSGITENTSDHILWNKCVNVSGSGSYIRFHKNYSAFSINMKKNLLVVKIKINSIESGAELYVKVGNSADPSKLIPYNLMRDGTTTVYGEWQEFTISYKAFANAMTAVNINDIDFENIDDVYVISSNGACDFDLQYIGYKPNQLQKGIVSFTFDDGWKTAKDGVKALAERGATSTLYVIEEATSQDYLTVAEMQELVQLYGTDIQAHGGTEYQNMTDDELIAHWKSIKKYLIENGLSNGDHLAYPGGKNPTRVYKLARKYFQSCRTIQGNIPFESFPPYDNHRMRAMTGISQNSVNNAALIKEYIDKAAETNSWLILVFHKIDDGTGSESCSMATFEEIADYAINSDIRIMNIAEVFETNGGGSGIDINSIIDALPIYNGEVE